MGVGSTELLLVLVLILLAAGPRRFPEIARWLGRLRGEMNRAAGEMRRGMESIAENEKAGVRGKSNPPELDEDDETAAALRELERAGRRQKGEDRWDD